MPKPNKFANDKYKKSRGGYSRLLSISCWRCGKHLFYYQKDGPGILKRVYIDRISGLKNIKAKNLLCPHCKEHLGIFEIYWREKRPAFRLFEGSINKRIAKI